MVQTILAQAGNQIKPIIVTNDDVPTWLIVLIVLTFFVVIFVGTYFLVCFATSARGWGGYASRHPGGEEPPAGLTANSGQSIMIGGNVAPANYRHVVTAGFNDEGIYLRMGKLFRWFHAPIFVPWPAVETVTQKPAIKGVYTAVEVQNLPRLVFFKSLGDQLHAHWQDHRGSATA